ncbi:MAG: alpha/beta hydrolase [Thaumarchaeota archaeon]|nr:alpha/beta hydrolase [Nitrososphaerota archaeon]
MAFFRNREGHQLYYVVRGTGRPIVFVHGWTMSHRVWDHQIFSLSDRYQVVAIDLRGHGESDKPESSYSFKEFANDLSDLFEHLNLNEIVLIGWSMGMSVSLSYFENYGGRHVSKLVLTGGPIKLSQAADYPHGIPPIDLEGYIRRKIDHRVAEEYAFGRKSYLKQSEEDAAYFVSIAMQTPLDVAIKSVREQDKLDHRALLGQIQVPTLVIYGRHERFYPSSLPEYIVSHLPKGKLSIFENSAHFPFQEEAKLFNTKLVEFIEEN